MACFGTSTGASIQTIRRTARCARRILRRLPLVWFVGVSPGHYLARYPVWLVADEPDQLQFAVALDDAQRGLAGTIGVDESRRSYVERITRQRLHQPLFRARVLEAYERQCAMCRLRHAELLDASHILLVQLILVNRRSSRTAPRARSITPPCKDPDWGQTRSRDRGPRHQS